MASISDIVSSIDKCIACKPKANTDAVREWVFRPRNGVVACVRKIFKNDYLRGQIKEAALRTHRHIIDREGPAQRLWAELRSKLDDLVNSKSNSLQRSVSRPSLGLLASLFDHNLTRHDAAVQLQQYAAAPLTIQADRISICHLHPTALILPFDKVVHNFMGSRHYKQYPQQCYLLGNSQAFLVMHRLDTLIKFITTVSIYSDFMPETESICWQGKISGMRQNTLSDIYQDENAWTSACAMALVLISIYGTSDARFRSGLTILDYRRDDSSSTQRFSLDENLRHTVDVAFRCEPKHALMVLSDGLQWVQCLANHTDFSRTHPVASPADELATTIHCFAGFMAKYLQHADASHQNYLNQRWKKGFSHTSTAFYWYEHALPLGQKLIAMLRENELDTDQLSEFLHKECNNHNSLIRLDIPSRHNPEESRFTLIKGLPKEHMDILWQKLHIQLLGFALDLQQDRGRKATQDLFCKYVGLS